MMSLSEAFTDDIKKCFFTINSNDNYNLLELNYQQFLYTMSKKYPWNLLFDQTKTLKKDVIEMVSICSIFEKSLSKIIDSIDKEILYDYLQVLTCGEYSIFDVLLFNKVLNETHHKCVNLLEIKSSGDSFLFYWAKYLSGFSSLTNRQIVFSFNKPYICALIDMYSEYRSFAAPIINKNIVYQQPKITSLDDIFVSFTECYSMYQPILCVNSNAVKPNENDGRFSRSDIKTILDHFSGNTTISMIKDTKVYKSANEIVESGGS